MRNSRSATGAVARGVSLVLAMSLLGAVGQPSSAGASPRPVAPSGEGSHDVAVRAPGTMVLRSGCRETYSMTASFDAAADEDYWVNLRGQDSQGHTIDGGTASGTATSTGRVRITRALLLCGSTHDAGTGVLQVNVHVGNEQISGRARIPIRYADRVRMKKPKRAVRRGQRVVLRGSWDRGPGFGRAAGYYNRKHVRVLIFFKPNGRDWRKVGTSRIDTQGNWRERVKVKRTGRYQARVRKSQRYLPARSAVRRVRVR